MQHLHDHPLLLRLFFLQLLRPFVHKMIQVRVHLF